MLSKPGQPLDMEKIHADVNGLMKAHGFSQVDAYYDESPPKSGKFALIFSVSEQAAKPAVPKNSPNLMVFPRDPLPVLRSGLMLVAESPDCRTLKAMSLDRGDGIWRDLTLAPGITASPLMSDNTVALILRGKTIDHVAVFTGEWSIQRLREPARDELTPLVLPGGALYQVGKDIYAFSTGAGSWGVLHLEGVEEPRVTYSRYDIEVLQGHRLYVFNLNSGRFSPGVEVNLKPFRRDPQEAKPAG